MLKGSKQFEKSDTMLNMRQIFGKSGEQTAAKYLKKKKYKIIELNYKNKLGEIDIVAEDNGTIVFVEVKTRSGFGYGSPKEAVTVQKQKTISKVALIWLKKNNKSGVKARFDVISIISDDKVLNIELIKNAFNVRY